MKSEQEQFYSKAIGETVAIIEANRASLAVQLKEAPQMGLGAMEELRKSIEAQNKQIDLLMDLFMKRP